MHPHMYLKGFFQLAHRTTGASAADLPPPGVLSTSQVLVFSDDFQDVERDFSSWCDSKWHALDLNYCVNGDALMIRGKT